MSCPEWRRHLLTLSHQPDSRLAGKFKTSALFGYRGTRPPCLIEGILPANGIVGLIGDQQTFKTFLATDLALHVSFGRPWFGHAVNQGPAVYISAEAPWVNQDIRDAWNKVHPELKDVGQFMPIDNAPELGRRNGDTGDLIAFIRNEIGRPRIVVIDTASKVLHGENEDKEGLIALMTNCERIVDAFGCVVLIPHHARRGELRSRGASQFENDAQGRLTLRRRGRDMSAILTVARLKGYQEGERILMRMSDPIEIDRTEYGKPVTSLVIESTEKAPEQKLIDGTSEVAKAAKTDEERRAAAAERKRRSRANARLPVTSRSPLLIEGGVTA